MIRATAGEDICIVAKASDALGNEFAGTMFCLFNEKEKILVVDGIVNGKLWEFHIPAEATAKLKGRYWYSVCDDTDTSLCFKNPIYFV